MIKIITSDIFKIPTDVMVHQVNCQGVMGAGLAKQIAQRYPKVLQLYNHASALYYPDDLLGKIQTIKVPDKIICNLFAQKTYGRTGCHTNYGSLLHCFKKVKAYMYAKDLKTLTIPYNIGCGLAGGNWDIVYKIIENVFKDLPDINVIICKLK